MTLPEKLAREIRRVTELRCRYASTGLLIPGGEASVRPAMAFMHAALERACVAAGSPDIQQQIAALQDLQGYTK